MMYYKISFNTWLNAMRKAKATELYPDGNPSLEMSKKEENKQVLIEVEEIAEYTSEEEASGDEEDFID